MQHHQRTRSPTTRPGLAAHQLGHVRVLLLRHHRRAGGEGVAHLHEAELLRAPEHQLLGDTREVDRADRERAPPSRAGSRGRRPRRGSCGSAARSRAPRAVASRSRGKVVPASAAEPSGHSFSRARGVEQPAAVALEHLRPGQQVVGEPHGLRALQVGVARQQEIDQPGRARRRARARKRSTRARRVVAAPRGSTGACRSRPDRCGCGRCGGGRRPRRSAR